MARKKTNSSKPISSKNPIKKSTKKPMEKPLRAPKAASKTALNRQIFFVLGMHRSGTSALSGLLHYAGCSVPKTLMAATERNPKGYFESELVYQLNEVLLKKAGSGWKSLQVIPPDFFGSPDGRLMAGQAEELLNAEFGKAALMVLKDPRNCRMVPFWRAAAQACDFEVCPILIHRNPLEVAKSLSKRDGIDTTEGLMIWLQHVLLAEYETRKTNRFITSYSQILSDWKVQIAGIETKFGMTFPKSGKPATTKKVNAFLQSDLQHFHEAPERIKDSQEVSQWVSTTYTILEKWAQDGETKASYAALDKVRREMNRALPMFAQIIEARTRTLSKNLKHRVKQVHTAHSRHRDYLEEIAELRSTLAQYVTENEELDNNRKKHTSTIGNLQDEIAEISQVLANRQEQIGKSYEVQSEQRSRIGKLKVEFEASLQRKSRQITKLEDDKSNANAALSAQIKQREADVARLSGTLDQHTEKTERLLSDLSDRQSQLQASNKKIWALEEEKATLLKDLEGINVRYEALQAAEKAVFLAEVGEAEADLKSLRDQLASTRSALAQRQLEAEETFERATVAERAHKEVEAENQKNRALALEQESRIKILQTRLDGMHNSRIWRMTKPLRKIVDGLRGNR